MEKLSKLIVKHYKFLFITFIILSILSIISSFGVNISYSMQDYMPEDSISMQNIRKMNQEFDEPVPNLRIAIKGVTIPEVMEYKERLSNLDSIKLIMWIDTFTNPYLPTQMIPEDLRNMYYKDSTALLSVAVESTNSKEALDEIKSLSDMDIAYEGALVEESAAQNAVNKEVASITAFIAPIVIIILLLAVKSWIEPFLLLLSIGIAILLNMGTNIFIEEVSFITQSVSGVLQLAVSLDYAIFLLHEFKHQKEIYVDRNKALEKAIEVSASAVVSSALTTIFGFLVLSFMRFKLGRDLGLVLAKGVIFSLLSVILFLPSIVKITMPWIEKTQHRDFLPNFRPLSRFFVNSRWIIIFLIVIVPIAFLGQLRNDFTYGMGEYQSDSTEYKDEKFIQDTFGKNIQMAILVPKGDISKESKLVEEISSMKYITSIQSYSEQVGEIIPSTIPPTEAMKSLFSENYSRIALNSTTEVEGKNAFDFVSNLENVVSQYYEEYYLIGEPVFMKEMSEIIVKDNNLVNLLAILSIAIVILINFKSIIIPILLVLTIESSIWINLAIPYFTGTKLSFIGYLVISSIQLGATVDYAILYTNNYLENRKTMLKKEALISSGEKVYGSLIPPAIILTSAGILLNVTSSISLVSELGEVLGRGAFLSLLLVVIILPILLYYFDKIIEKTTYKSNFRKE